MGAEKDIIVAVELGSTYIRAIAGKRESDGTMRVLALAQENATNAIRKGLIDNIDKTTQAISRVVGQLNDKLGVCISRIYMGLSGQSLHTVSNLVPRQFPERTQITNEMVDQLKDTNQAIAYPDYQILDVIPQEYRVGNRFVTDPVGMQSDHLEAHFMNVIARTCLSENIEKCVRSAGLELVELLISPLCLADCLLSANEKRSGCALVDMGADTTTVSVFTNNILRHLTVIPLGGSNVTTDIAYMKMEQDEAESLKLKYGTACRKDEESKPSHKIKISHDRTVEEELLHEIVEARYEEIIANAWEHIAKESDKLLSGIVLTGGAAQIKDIDAAFSKHTDKPMRFAKGLPINIQPDKNVHIGDTDCPYTLMALLLKGDQNCVGEVPATDEVITETPVQEEPVQEETVQEEEIITVTEETPKETKKTGEELGKTAKKWWNKISDIFAEDQ